MRVRISGDKTAATMTALECVRRARSRLFPPILLAAWLALGSASTALAQRWIVEPSVEAQATLTNNANYDRGSQREGDLVLNVLPAVVFSREGPRLRVAGAASLNMIGYVDGTQESRLQPQANILANLEAIDRFFYVEAALLANQQVLNPFLPQSDTASTFNKYTYAQGRIAPYFQGNVGTNWRYLVRSDNSFTYTTQADTTLEDAYSGRHVAELVRASTPLGGSLRVQSDVTRFSGQDDAQQLDLARATLNYAFTPQFTAGLRGGYESTNYTVNDTSGPIYGAELAWTPTPLTSLAGFWESRFFGPSYQFDLSNRQRSLATNLSVSRSASTYPQRLILELPGTSNVSSLLNAILTARFPDPVERAQQVQDLIARQGLPSSLPGAVNIYNTSVDVVTSASGTLALIGVRNTLALNLYYLKTNLLPDAAIPPTFITISNTTQRGATLSLNHRLSPVTTLNATAGWRETRDVDQSPGTISDQNLLEVQASRQLTPHSSAFIGARYQQQDSTSGVIRDSSEAAIFVGLFYRL